MSKTEKLVQLYKDMLSTCSHTFDDKGRVLLEVKRNEAPVPIKIDGKQLVLPMSDLLRHPEDDQIFFHPLSEQVVRGESEVFMHLKRAMILKLTTSVSMIGTGLLALLGDTSAQRKMSIDQINLIKGITDTDNEKSPTAWLSMVFREIKQNPGRMDMWPINIHMRRNGAYAGKSYRRVAVTHFPLFEKIFNGEKFEDDSGKDLYRKKDYPMFQQVAKAIFPDVDDPTSEVYNAGYDETVGPYTVCFLRAYKKLADRINEILKILEEPLKATNSDYQLLAGIKTDWWEVIRPEAQDDLISLAKSVPPLNGNMGQSPDAAPEEQPKRVEKIGKYVIKEAAKPARAQETVVEKPKVQERASELQKVTTEGLSNEGLNPEQVRLRDEAMRRREEFLKREEEEKRYREEREERRRRREEEERAARDEPRRDRDDDRRRDRDYDRDDRDDDRRDRGRDRDRDRDDHPQESAAPGKLSFSSIVRSDPDLIRGTRSEEEDRDYGRGRRDRGSRYDSRDRYDDRDRGRGRSRYESYDDRGRGRDRYDDRGRSRYDDRGYGRR